MQGLTLDKIKDVLRVGDRLFSQLNGLVAKRPMLRLLQTQLMIIVSWPPFAVHHSAHTALAHPAKPRALLQKGRCTAWLLFFNVLPKGVVDHMIADQSAGQWSESLCPCLNRSVGSELELGYVAGAHAGQRADRT